MERCGGNLLVTDETQDLEVDQSQVTYDRDDMIQFNLFGVGAENSEPVPKIQKYRILIVFRVVSYCKYKIMNKNKNKNKKILYTSSSPVILQHNHTCDGRQSCPESLGWET